MTKKRGRGLSERGEEELIIRFLLACIFKDATPRGETVRPDQAVEELSHRLSSMIADVGDAPNWRSLIEAGFNIYPEEDLREAHHIAVDMYYDARFGKARSRGAPKQASLHLLTLAAKRWHKSYKEIADELGLPTASLDDRLVSLDKVKKRVKAARERFPQLALPAEAPRSKGK